MDKQLTFYLCCLNGTFPLLQLSMTAYPRENLGTTIQHIAFIIFQDGFCKFTIQRIDLAISNTTKEEIIQQHQKVDIQISDTSSNPEGCALKENTFSNTWSLKDI